jgi:hypothetical protein
MFNLDNHIIIPGAGSGTANHSLAPFGGVSLATLRSFSPALDISGLHQGVNGARPVFLPQRRVTIKTANSVQPHPLAVMHT